MGFECRCGMSNCDHRMFIDAHNGNKDGTIDLAITSRRRDPITEEVENIEMRVTLTPLDVRMLLVELQAAINPCRHGGVFRGEECECGVLVQ